MHIADALGTLGNISVVDGLLKMLDARDIPSRLHMRIIEATGFLGKTCNGTKVQDILSRLQNILYNSSIDADVRGHAAIALGRIGEQFSKKVLDLLINSKVDAYIRKSITIAMGETIHEVYVPILLKLLENQEEELGLRILAADALSSIGRYSDPQLSPNLLAELLFRLQAILLQPNLDSSVGGSIIDALSKFGERSIASSTLVDRKRNREHGHKHYRQASDRIKARFFLKERNGY